ncbi:hypothetical protein GCM10010221_48860 [Streptomyces parvus]|nr:hypothetical protein GCM10010221_48860 [Streptomyces parvus]
MVTHPSVVTAPLGDCGLLTLRQNVSAALDSLRQRTKLDLFSRSANSYGSNRTNFVLSVDKRSGPGYGVARSGIPRALFRTGGFASFLIAVGSSTWTEGPSAGGCWSAARRSPRRE